MIKSDFRLPNSQIHRSRSSTREFLFYKTDTVNRNDLSGKGIRSDFSASSVGLNELLKAFPNILIGESFQHAAETKIYPSGKFSAMTVQTDVIPESYVNTVQDKEADIKYATILLLNVAKIIDAVCKYPFASDCIWGLVDYKIFGCFFPDRDEQFCLEFSDKIRKNLSKLQNKAVAIGIALYPFGNFYKEQILENACKAMIHARLAGPGSTVFFDAVSLNVSGDKLYQEGNVAGAVEEFKTAILIDPSNVNVHNSLGVCYGVMGDYKKALESFEAALRLDTNEVMAIYNAGLSKMLMGDKSKAIEDFLKAEHIGEDIFEIAFQLGKIYFEMKNFKQAGKYFEKAARLKPDSGVAFRYLGDCYAALNIPGKAVIAYKKAIKQNPYDAASLSAMGYLFDVMGENPEISIMFCQHSVKFAPENGLFRYRLGRLYLKQNRPDDALKEFIEAINSGYAEAAPFVKKLQGTDLEDKKRKAS